MTKPILLDLILVNLLSKQFKLGASAVSWSMVIFNSIGKIQHDRHWPYENLSFLRLRITHYGTPNSANALTCTCVIAMDVA